MAEPRTAAVAQKPKVSPAEARLAKVMGALGTQKGWALLSTSRASSAVRLLACG